jgi:hypothetical protein
VITARRIPHALAERHCTEASEEQVELLAHVALNLFTNDLNLAFDVPVDFPAVPLRRAA